MILNKFKKIYFINLFLTLLGFILTYLKFFCPKLDILNFYFKLFFLLTWTLNDVVINQRCDELKKKYMLLDTKCVFLKRYLISRLLLLLGFIFMIKIFAYFQESNNLANFIIHISNCNNLKNIDYMMFLISILLIIFLVLLMWIVSLVLYMYNKLKIFIFLDDLEKKEISKIVNQNGSYLIFSKFTKRHFLVVKMYYLTFIVLPFLFLFIIFFINHNLIFNWWFLKFYYLLLLLPLLIGHFVSWINFYKLALLLDKI